MNKYKIEQWMPDVGLGGSWKDVLNDYAEADSAALAIELAKDYIIENVDENYLEEHDLTPDEFAGEVEKESYRAFKRVITEDGEVWAPCGIAPVSVNFIEYAIEYMTDIDDKEQITYWSDPNHYMAEPYED